MMVIPRRTCWKSCWLSASRHSATIRIICSILRSMRSSRVLRGCQRHSPEASLGCWPAGTNVMVPRHRQAAEGHCPLRGQLRSRRQRFPHPCTLRERKALSPTSGKASQRSPLPRHSRIAGSTHRPTGARCSWPAFAWQFALKSLRPCYQLMMCIDTNLTPQLAVRLSV